MGHVGILIVSLTYVRSWQLLLELLFMFEPGFEVFLSKVIFLAWMRMLGLTVLPNKLPTNRFLAPVRKL